MTTMGHIYFYKVVIIDPILFWNQMMIFYAVRIKLSG